MIPMPTTITPTMIEHLRLMASGRAPLPSQFRRFAGDNLRTLRATLEALDAGEAVPDADLLAYLEDWKVV